MRDGKEYGKPEGWPMFIAEEKSSSGPIQAEACCCGCCNQPDFANPEGQPIMTYERLGCCTRFANCWVCCESCQDEMRFHSGGGFDPSMAGDIPTATVVGVGKVPIGGGGCTPTVEIFAAPGEAGGTTPVNVPMAGKPEG